MQYVHLVAHALYGLQPLADPNAARWLVHKLREVWPDALAACLMLDHLHLIAPGEPRAARRRLSGVLSGFSRSLEKPARIWNSVAEPRLIPNAKHLQRQVRYVLLNPCRDGLASDPLAWKWSTHRGVIGAEVSPWVSADRLARAIDWDVPGFRSRFHRYVSGDPSVHPAGSALPISAEPCDVAKIPLEAIVSAATSATAWLSNAERRHALCLLARHQGWRDADRVAIAAESSSDHVRRLWRKEAPELLRAAALCLGDPRLR